MITAWLGKMADFIASQGDGHLGLEGPFRPAAVVSPHAAGNVDGGLLSRAFFTQREDMGHRGRQLAPHPNAVNGIHNDVAAH